MALRVGSKYKIGKKIGGGSFGDIYLGVDLSTDDQVAIKLELRHCKHPQLGNECAVYKALEGGGTCAPATRGSGRATGRPRAAG